jgi:hypothetical protein
MLSPSPAVLSVRVFPLTHTGGGYNCKRERYSLGTEFMKKATKMAYPIIVVHTGGRSGSYPHFLDCALKQAHFSNPESRIILLGDAGNKRCPAFVEHYDVSGYIRTAEEFARVYRHLSSNSYDFELFSFQRWFILLEFVKKHRLERFMHIDSDVLVYSDFGKEADFMHCLEKYDIGIDGMILPHFFNNISVLDKFCRFAVKSYNDKKFLDRIEEKYRGGAAIHFGAGIDWDVNPISDMTFWCWFLRASKDMKYLELAYLKSSNGSEGAFDLNINTPYNGVHVIGGVKNIIFNDKIPYGIRNDANSLLRFHVLHFQGLAKRLIPLYSTFDKGEGWKQPEMNLGALKYIFRDVLAKNNLIMSSLKKMGVNFLCAFVPVRSARHRLRGSF